VQPPLPLAFKVSVLLSETGMMNSPDFFIDLNNAGNKMGKQILLSPLT
jgi:hypothetical protein